MMSIAIFLSIVNIFFLSLIILFICLLIDTIADYFCLGKPFTFLLLSLCDKEEKELEKSETKE